MFPFINNSVLKLTSESDDRFARKIYFPVEKSRSTAALDGIVIHSGTKLAERVPNKENFIKFK